MGKERLEGKGLEEGHTLQSKEMSRLVAPFRARFYLLATPQATPTSGLCTLGLLQVKAVGLVQAFDLLVHYNCPNDSTACRYAENRCNKSQMG